MIGMDMYSYYGRSGLLSQVDWTLLLLVAAFILSLVVQFRMQSTFSRYSRVRVMNGMTGEQVARLVLQSEGLYDVQVKPVAGSLTDHYDPRTKTVGLSQTVFGVPSLAAQSVAAHECGHAIQDARGYAPLRARTSLAPVASFGSRFSWILFILGLVMSSYFLIKIGIVLFSVALLFQLITLPVEFDASHRALLKLQASGWMQPEELAGSKKVLGAAALTYVAAACSSLMYLLRMMFMGRRRRARR